MEGDIFSGLGNGTPGDGKVLQTFNKSFGQVQDILDQNRVLINEINQNHESKVPDNLSRNVGLIRELNNNIRRVVNLYADLSSSFTRSVESSSEGELAGGLSSDGKASQKRYRSGLSLALTMSQLSKLYLFTYNSLQAFGWAVYLFLILSNFLLSNSINAAYASAGEIICLLQASSFLEVVHGAIGIVPSGVLFPLMQWGGRTFVLLMIVRKIDEVQESPSVFICFVAWSLSEVIRYPYYALNCIGNCSSWITLLRYTAFLVLYPIGLVPGEMWLMYGALPYIKVLLVCYPFLGLNLYLYLLKRSRLSKRREKKLK
ncbi:hypothetical protein LWI28_012859 [Acer negundo]|uniref:Very-long-chain (3R)-3-hydroxyacyl-CoA dehydratase n=1 Tax=Acer negundo TaxID=4023 RepID=A0AAD5NHQ8_ACENE|nr:hypothetical protein LWI28_012859 [Acer negundo]